MNISLHDVISEWIETSPLKRHIKLEEYRGGSFIALACVNRRWWDPTTLAYVGQHAITGEWLHDLNPSDPNFFHKLELFLIETHNRLRESGCGAKL